MKKTILMMIVVSWIPFSLVLGQNQTTQSWINGTWENSLISDLRLTEIWTFDRDSIYVEKGMQGARIKKCLSNDYPGYKQSQTTEGQLHHVTFSKGNDTVVYEFKQRDADFAGKPVLTYSLTINGIKKAEHSQSAFLVFLKRK